MTHRQSDAGAFKDGEVETEFLVFKSSRIHGLGAYARVDIPAGTRIIEYVGQKITKAESTQRCKDNNEYIFNLNEELDLDGNVGWNPAKFINHSCDPNCEAELIDEHIWINSVRPIEKGEEVTFNYGYDWEDYREHPCRCGTSKCVGYIVAEEYFPRLRKKAESA